jgi:hypothetical protein
LRGEATCSPSPSSTPEPPRCPRLRGSIGRFRPRREPGTVASAGCFDLRRHGHEADGHRPTRPTPADSQVRHTGSYQARTARSDTPEAIKPGEVAAPCRRN